jgi:putative flippase GtrA/SAM-dependent methyltransferase
VSAVAEIPADRRRDCPICGSGERRQLHPQRFAGVEGGSLLDGYDVVVCGACGFGFADNLPPQADFDAYYREMSKYENPERGGGISDFDRRRFELSSGLIADLLPDRGLRILDVGCATGGLLSFLKAKGYRELVGLDPSPACGAVAKRLYDLEVLSGTLADLPADIPPFDLVILGAVLEHVRDLGTVLEQVRARLRPGGRLFVEVPDAASFTCAEADSPYQEFSIEHINYFSGSSLANLLALHGFAEEDSRSFSLQQRPGSQVHEVKALFRVAEPVRAIAKRDEVTERGITAYLEASARVDGRIRAVVDRLVAAGTPILVWGVGTLTQRLLASGDLARAQIRAFVDSNPRYQGKTVSGIPILSPRELTGRSEPILVSSLISQEEIARQIRKDLGLGNRIIKFAPAGLAGAEGRQLIRYLLVGAWNTAFGYGLFAGLTYALTGRVAHAYMLASVLASVIAITSAFFLHKTFVFRTKGNALREFLRMNAVYGATTLLGLVLLPILVYVTTRIVGAGWAPYLSQAILIPVGTLAGFVGHKRFSFRAGDSQIR